MRSIPKIEADITKTKAKINEFQTRLKELEREKTDAENSEIVEIVRSGAMTAADLSAMIRAYQENGLSKTTKEDEVNEE